MRNLENRIPGENEETEPENDNLENFDSIELKEQEKPIDATKPEAIAVEEKQEKLEQPEFKKDIEAIEKQEEEIKIQKEEREDSGLLSRLSQKGRKFAGVALLSLSSFAGGLHDEARISAAETPQKYSHSLEKEELNEKQIERKTEESFRYFIKNSVVANMEDGSFAVDMPVENKSPQVAVDIGERPCYKVGPKELAEMERIRQEYFQKINLVSSRRFASASMVKESIKTRTEKTLKRVIRSCEKIPPDQLPEEIKTSRVAEQKEINEKIAQIKSRAEMERVKTELERQKAESAEKEQERERKPERESEASPAVKMVVERIERANRELKKLNEIERLEKSGELTEEKLKKILELENEK